MEWLEWDWRLLVGRGAAALVVGLLAMFAPLPTIVALMVLLGAWALVDGITGLVTVYRADGVDARILQSAVAVIALATGVLALTSPLLGAAVVTWFIGAWLAVRGVVEAVAAFIDTGSEPRWLRLLAALLSLVAGALVLLNPGSAALSLAFWLGVTSVLWGIVLVVAGVMSRRVAPAAVSPV